MRAEVSRLPNGFVGWRASFVVNGASYYGYGSTQSEALNSLIKQLDNHAVELLQAIKDVKAQAREVES